MENVKRTTSDRFFLTKPPALSSHLYIHRILARNEIVFLLTNCVVVTASTQLLRSVVCRRLFWPWVYHRHLLLLLAVVAAARRRLRLAIVEARHKFVTDRDDRDCRDCCLGCQVSLGGCSCSVQDHKSSCQSLRQ